MSTTGTNIGEDLSKTLTDLEQKLYQLAHSHIAQFAQYVEAMKNNHGVNMSAVETFLGQAANFAGEAHKAIDDLVSDAVKKSRAVCGYVERRQPGNSAESGLAGSLGGVQEPTNSGQGTAPETQPVQDVAVK